MTDRFRRLWGRFLDLQRGSTNSRIFGAMLTVGGLTMMVKLTVAAKDLVVAARFGTSDALEAFLTAFIVPLFAVQVIAGSFSSSLIPTFIAVREREGRDAAQRLFSSVVIAGLALLVTTSLVLAASSGYLLPLLAARFSPEKLALTRTLFFLLLPILVVSGLGTTWAAVLNASERFALAAIAPLVTPLFPVVALLLGGSHVRFLVAGTVAGFLAEASLLGWGLKRCGFSLLPRWRGIDPGTKQVLAQYLPMFAGAALMSSNILVDQAMTALLGPGSVASLNYGNKVVSFVAGLGTISISSAVLPHFSRMVALSDWVGLRHTVRFYLRLVMAVVIPLTAVFIFLSVPIVRLLFQRGAFTATDTALVGRIQAFSLCQVPFYVGSTLLVRLISSLKANRILFWGAGINVVTNVVADYLLSKWLGVAGIALSTAVVMAVSFTFLGIMLTRVFRQRSTETSVVPLSLPS